MRLLRVVFVRPTSKYTCGMQNFYSPMLADVDLA